MILQVYLVKPIKIYWKKNKYFENFHHCVQIMVYKDFKTENVKTENVKVGY